MNGWSCAALIVLVALLYGGLMIRKILRDNRPGPRWPGDP